MIFMDSIPQESLEHYKALYEKYQLLAENTVECIWLMDFTNKRFRYISPSIFQLRGYTPEEAMKESLEESLTPESLAKMNKIAKQVFDAAAAGEYSPDGISSVHEYQLYCKDGSIKDVEISTRIMLNEKENTIDVLGVSRDISQRKRLEAALNQEIEEKNRLIEKLSANEGELLRLANELKSKNTLLNSLIKTDNMTGAHSRYYFEHRVHNEMQRAKNYSLPLSIIFFDLDHFKTINDSFGHDVGDEVLISVASIAEKFIRMSDLFARWGGEEFMILLPRTDLSEATRLAEELRILLSQTPYSIAVSVTASFGIAQWEAGETFEHWFKRVDYALYRSKSNGRNRVTAYRTTESLPAAVVRLEWRGKWESGNKLIDGQHRELLHLSDRLLDLSISANGRDLVMQALDALLAHVVLHFTDEEQLQRDVGYPEYAEHAQIHQVITEKALVLKKQFLKGEIKATAFFSFLVDEVIMGHLLAEDTKFFPYTRDKTLHPFDTDDWEKLM